MDYDAFLGTIGLLALVVGFGVIFKQDRWTEMWRPSWPWVLVFVGAGMAFVGVALGYQPGEVWLIQEY